MTASPDGPPMGRTNFRAAVAPTGGLHGSRRLAVGLIAIWRTDSEDYLAFLQAGTTRYPLDIFKLAGVDMTSPVPVEQAFAALAGFVDRLEELTE